MPDTPLVSVLMNCFNAGEHLAEALRSVFAQSEQNFEIVFYDNCSTDASPSIAKSFGEKVHYVRADEHIPLGSARNRAIAEAKGAYIAFLDCDDLWRPTKLAKQLACFAHNPAVGLVTTDTLFLHGTREGGRLFAQTTPARGHVFADLLERQWISMSSAMIKRDALDSLTKDKALGGWFDETLQVCEEADVFYRIAHDWELDYVDEALTLWRIHGTNTTFRRFGAFASETLYIIDKLKHCFPTFASDYADLVTLLEQRAHFQKAVDLWRTGQGQEARALLDTLPTTKKHRLFRLCSYLPGSCFDLAANLYFALPAWLRT